MEPLKQRKKLMLVCSDNGVNETGTARTIQIAPAECVARAVDTEHVMGEELATELGDVAGTLGGGLRTHVLAEGESFHADAMELFRSALSGEMMEGDELVIPDGKLLGYIVHSKQYGFPAMIRDAIARGLLVSFEEAVRRLELAPKGSRSVIFEVRERTVADVVNGKFQLFRSMFFQDHQAINRDLFCAAFAAALGWFLDQTTARLREECTYRIRELSEEEINAGA